MPTSMMKSPDSPHVEATGGAELVEADETDVASDGLMLSVALDAVVRPGDGGIGVSALDQLKTSMWNRVE